MGRSTNRRLNHRELKQAYADYWLAQKGTDEGLAYGWRDQGSPRQTRWIVWPYGYDKRTTGTK